MRPYTLFAVGAACAALLPGGATAQSPSDPGVLHRYDLTSAGTRFELPGRLDEVSGLAFTPDGRLFAHDDERGRVHEIDSRSGEVGKRFDLGQGRVRDDFEGIAIVDDRFFLVSSTGLLYEFREAEDREGSNYRVTDSGVGANCEIEGLAYDASESVLLLACKVATPDHGMIVVHRLPIDPDVERPAPLRIAKAQLIEFGLDSDFDPSGMAVTTGGTYLLVSGRHDALIEVSRQGRVLNAVELSGRRHPQSEGLELAPDGTLYISDERNDGPARLTAYRPEERGLR